MNTVNKMLKWIGISDEEEEIYEVEETETEEVEPIMPIGRKAKVSSIAGGSPSKVVVIQFLNFDDAN